MNDPIAQDPQAAAAGAEQQSNVEQPNGVEKRIDELVSKFHQADRDNTELRRLHAEQQATINQLTGLIAQQRQPQVREEAPEIDPDDARKISYIVREATAPLQRQLADLTASMAQSQVGTEMSEVRAQLQKINNPAVARRVDELLKVWKQDGRLATRSAVPMDALRLAAGELALGMLGEGVSNHDQRRSFNEGGLPPLSAAGGGSVRKTASAPITASRGEADLLDMSSDQLAEFIRKNDNPNAT